MTSILYPISTFLASSLYQSNFLLLESGKLLIVPGQKLPTKLFRCLKRQLRNNMPRLLRLQQLPLFMQLMELCGLLLLHIRRVNLADRLLHSCSNNSWSNRQRGNVLF